MKLGYLALLSGLVVSIASVNLYNAPATETRIAAGMEMPGKEAFDYYGTKRGGVSGWANRFALMSFEPFFQFNAIDAGKEIHVPSLVIHSDKALTPDSAKRFYQSIPAKDKSIHWMVTSNHIDFYDQSRYVEEATDKAAGWFLSKL